MISCSVIIGIHSLLVISRIDSQQFIIIFEFYNINSPMKIFLFFSIFLLTAFAQLNICYANCRQGYCDPQIASRCTDCEPAFINLNGVCVGGNTQSKPITYLKPNSKNGFNQPNKDAIFCNVTNSDTNINTSMIFLPTIGSTFTQAFEVSEPHSFLQIKFNAILAAQLRAPTNPSLLFTLFDINGNSIPGLLYNFNTSRNPVRCTQGYFAQNVFYMLQKFSSSLNYIIVELRTPGNVGSTIAVSDFQIYYGNCSQQCNQCTGPSSSQCISCDGFLTTLRNNRCQNCPSGFYQNILCMECPVECEQCQLVNNEVKCTTCNTRIAVLDFTSMFSCRTNFTQLITFNELNFNRSDWKSTEISGNIVTKCRTYSIIAGISIGTSGSSISNTYQNLPTHTVIYLSFTLLLIDQVGDTTLYQIQLDEETIIVNIEMTPETDQKFTDECGNSGFQFITRQFFIFNHTKDTANIRITFLKNYGGIRNIALVFNNQTNVSNCYRQDNGVCISCRNGFALVNNTCSSCADGYYLDNKTCLICPITCRTCLRQPNRIACLTCSNPLVYQEGLCVDTTGSLFAAEIFDNVPITNNQWVFYPNLQNRGIDFCSTYKILGSSQNKFNFLNVSKRFTGIPAHTGIVAVFNFFQIDDYSQDQSVRFSFGSNRTIYRPNNLKMNLCGNATADSITPVYLQDSSHTGDTLDFQIQFTRMVKFGINNFMVYLLRNGDNGATPFEMTSIPTYSINTPPIKGLTLKLVFPQQFQNVLSINDAIQFRLFSNNENNNGNNIIIVPNNTNSTTNNNATGNSNSTNNGSRETNRTLQALIMMTNSIPIQNSTINSNRQITYLLSLNQDYNNYNIEAKITNLSKLYYLDANNNKNFFSQRKVVTEMPRYIDMNVDDISNRSTTKNIYNLFRGLAILALFIGLASFLFGMSTAFDDFFLLCQLIFVHIFIQLDFNPPSLRIPFQGLSIVQFLSWFPWEGRQGIQNGIIPKSLYQLSPLVYQQYYHDIVFARTIYQTVLFIIAMAILWIILKIILTVWDSHELKTKYNNYILYYYNNYNNRMISFVDKVVRFIYFTVVWACILQFIKFSNEPRSFNIWNSVLTIVFFILAVAYPIFMFLLLRRYSNTMTSDTFNKLFQDLRLTPQTFYYFIFRYYRLILIACIIGLLYNSSPIIPLVILIVLNLADALILIIKKPLLLNQQELINASIFYPKYPQMYHYTMIIEKFLFILMEIMFLVLFGQRKNSSRQAYMGIGYAICALVIVLLVNGVIRLFWSLMKLCEQIYLQRQSFQLSVDKEVQERKDPAQEHPIIQQILKTEVGLSRYDLNQRLNSKKTSFVSKLRG